MKWCPRCDYTCTPVGVSWWRCLKCGYKFIDDTLDFEKLSQDNFKKEETKSQEEEIK